jgi:hypothetical protein
MREDDDDDDDDDGSVARRCLRADVVRALVLVPAPAPLPGNVPTTTLREELIT